jgi:membrane-bound lytic murein transglycosylase D
MKVRRLGLAALIAAFLLALSCPELRCHNNAGSSPAAGADYGKDYERGEIEDLESPPADGLLFSAPPEAPALGSGDGQEAGPAASQGKGNLTEEESKIIETIRRNLDASTASDGFDIPVVLNDAVDLYIKYFSGVKRKVFARWLVRAKTYAPTIRSILKANNLPEDLVYLAMIESGFNMRALSSAKAKGPWQFIHETGERYGLRVGFWVDERCDLEKSTVAAARYLKELFDRFGCWYLAAAGYNAGEHRVERAIEKHDTKDFWKLRQYKTLPKETQEYVPKLIAAALIAKDPEKYGFAETPASSAGLTRVEVPGGLPLPRIACALSIDSRQLAALNPELVRGVTPPDRKSYKITLPGTSDADAAKNRLAAELDKGGRIVGVVKYPLKKRDSLAGILRRYHVSRSDLALVNNDMERPRLASLRVVYIPKFASKTDKSPLVRTATGEDGPTDALSQEREGGIITLPSLKKGHAAKKAKPILTKQVIHKADKRVRHSHKAHRRGNRHSR